MALVHIGVNGLAARFDQNRTLGRKPIYFRSMHKRSWLLSGFGVVSIGLRDQGGDKSAEQGLSAAAGVMHELEEAEIERQLLL